MDVLLDNVHETLPVEVIAVFDVPSSRLFQSWTKPSEIEAWFGRPRCEIIKAEIDLQVGGAWRFAYNNTDWFEGVYSKIVDNECLNFTWRHVRQGSQSPISEVQVEFHSEHSRTRMIITHYNLQSGDGRDGVSVGWNASVNALAHILRGEK